MRYLFILIFSLLNLVQPSFAQSSTSTVTADTTELSNVESVSSQESIEDDDFAPGLLFLVLIAFGLSLMAIGAGIILTLLGILLLFGLVSLGITSASILVALNKKSIAKGFRVFILLTSSVGGLIIGTLTIYAFNLIVHWWSVSTAITLGGLSGLLGGIGIGYTSLYILRRLTEFLKQRLA